MRYSLKIIPTDKLTKMPQWGIQVEQISEGNVSSLADLDTKLVADLNRELFNYDIELDDGLFDQVDQSAIFDDIKKAESKCPMCEK